MAMAKSADAALQRRLEVTHEQCQSRHKFESVVQVLRTNNTMMKVQGVAMRFLLVAVVAVSSITTYVCADASNPLVHLEQGTH